MAASTGQAIERSLDRAFAPLHKRAFAVATGATAALVLFLITAFHVIAAPPDAPNLELLSEFFYGYHVSWRGAAVGAWWSFVAGFTGGWFLAFVHNLSLATWLFVIGVKADLASTTGFLDHI